jgi:hypothetical protein
MSLKYLKPIILALICVAALSACVPWTVNPNEPSQANPSGKGPSTS